MREVKGFTLSEVVMVLLIAVILFFILSPLPIRREKPRQIACLSNLKQIGLAMAEYSQDSDERLPLRQASDGPNGRTVSWRLLLEPYTKSTAVFQCLDNPGRQWPDIESDGIMRSYAVNSSGGGRNGIGGPFDDRHPALPLDKIKHPESVIAVVESTAAFNEFNPLFPGAFAKPSGHKHAAGYLFAAHSGGSNYLFVDGHARWKKPLDMLGIKPNPWTIDGSPYSTTDLATARSTLAYAVAQGKN